MRARWLALVALLGVCATVAGAEEPTEFERFQLANGCNGMDLVIENLRFKDRFIGLTKKSVRNYAESRLRSAGLFDPEWGRPIQKSGFFGWRADRSRR